MPLARFDDGTEFGRYVRPGRMSISYGTSSGNAGLRFAVTPEGVIAQSRGNWTRDVSGEEGERDEILGMNRKLVGFLRAIGAVDLVIGPGNGVLYVADVFVMVPRFLSDADFGTPVPAMPAGIRVDRSGYERLLRWLREEVRIRTSDYEWSGRKSPPPIRNGHQSGPTISFYVDAPRTADFFRQPAQTGCLFSWHGPGLGWSVAGGEPVEGATFAELALRQLEVNGAIAPESRSAAWWAANSVTPVVLERFTEARELYDLLGEPSPVLWSDERFCEWLRENE